MAPISKNHSFVFLADKWLIIDEELPPLDYLIIEGGLSAAPDADLDFVLNASYIIVSGRLAIGWEDEPFNGTAKILLRGRQSSPDVLATSGPPLGKKFLGMLCNGGIKGVEWGLGLDDRTKYFER